jgi:hypothetical protein
MVGLIIFAGGLLWIQEFLRSLKILLFTNAEGQVHYMNSLL